MALLAYPHPRAPPPLLLLLSLLACGPAPSPGPADGGGGTSTPAEVPELRAERSLSWTTPALLEGDGPASFARVLAAVAPGGNVGPLLRAWFHRFATTAHSERALPSQFVDAVAAAQGEDPAAWDLSVLPFSPTGIHNRIDLAELRPGGHCGELRVSHASTDPTLQPFHLLFLFRQPAEPDDLAPDGTVHCAGTARRWAALSGLEGPALEAAVRERLAQGLTHDRFLLAESVEFTLAPWEWRQWEKVPDPTGALPFLLDNPPLFQQVDVERVNAPGPLREAFLSFVQANAAALAGRWQEIPRAYRAPSIRINQGVERTPLSLAGLDPAVSAAHPALRQAIERVGCAACHTADADFVHLRPGRGPSPFYVKELSARVDWLARAAQGLAPQAPFGPLQKDPVLP